MSTITITETEVIEYLANIMYKSVKYPKKTDCIKVLQEHPFDSLEDILQKSKIQALKMFES